MSNHTTTSAHHNSTLPDDPITLSRWRTLRCCINRLPIPSRLVRVPRCLQLNSALLSTKVSLIGSSALGRVCIRSSIVRTIIAILGRGVHGWHTAGLLRVLLVAVLVTVVLLLRCLVVVVRRGTASPAGERVWVLACAAATAGCNASMMVLVGFLVNKA